MRPRFTCSCSYSPQGQALGSHLHSTGQTLRQLPGGQPSVLLRELKVLQLILWPLGQLPQLLGVQPRLCVWASICRERAQLHKFCFIRKKPASEVTHH